MTSTETTPNVELLRQTMDHILAYPELHRQDSYAVKTECGTAYGADQHSP